MTEILVYATIPVIPGTTIRAEEKETEWRVRGWLLLSCVVSRCCTCANAQVITASLQGIVEDSSGAVIPGAKIRVVNTATNVATAATTGADGAFVAPSLTPGSYRVEVEAAGFKKLERTGVDLRVDQAARIRLIMEIGSLTESVKSDAVKLLCWSRPHPPWGK